MLTDLRVACAVLTRLPVGLTRPPGRAELLQSVHWFPIAGVAVGAAAALAFLLAGLIGLPGLPALLLALATQILATGALHEIGLAATLDALRPTTGRDAAGGRLGTLALVLAVLARVAALTTFWSPASFAAALVAASAASRAALPAVMLVQPAAPNGSGGRPDPTRVALGRGLACAVAVALLPPRVAAQALLWAGLAAATVAVALGRRLGGCSGDGLGAVQQAGEIAFLLSLSADGWPRSL
jgi:adenosylcobinamide-GDP ribazoletransferase